MNLQQQEQFYQAMSGLKSRAASTQETRVTEVLNGIICSKSKAAATTKEPEIIDLQRSASIQGINKLRVIQDFINGRH